MSLRNNINSNFEMRFLVHFGIKMRAIKRCEGLGKNKNSKSNRSIKIDKCGVNQMFIFQRKIIRDSNWFPFTRIHMEVTANSLKINCLQCQNKKKVECDFVWWKKKRITVDLISRCRQDFLKPGLFIHHCFKVGRL